MKNHIKNVHKEFDEFFSEFLKESQRSAIILLAAKMDDLLYQVIKKSFLPSLKKVDELLENDGALSTFNAKINLSYRCAYIDEEMARALHFIRKIRNSFAHDIKKCDLDLTPYLSYIREIREYFKEFPEFEEYITNFKKAFSIAETGSRGDFYVICGIIVWSFMKKIYSSRRNVGVSFISLIPFGWSWKKHMRKLVKGKSEMAAIFPEYLGSNSK